MTPKFSCTGPSLPTEFHSPREVTRLLAAVRRSRVGRLLEHFDAGALRVPTRRTSLPAVDVKNQSDRLWKYESNTTRLDSNAFALLHVCVVRASKLFSVEMELLALYFSRPSLLS